MSTMGWVASPLRSAEEMKETIARCILAFQHGIGESHRPEDRVIVEKYLSALAPLLAKAVVNGDMKEDLKAIDRLFEHTWIVDPEPFAEAFDIWNRMVTEHNDPPDTQQPNQAR